MVIANPIYDVVFKRLMEDQRVAKFFIETLLEETIEEVEVQPQEFTHESAAAGLAVFRLDFIATIRTASQEFKKVLIEIQKARHPIDLMRFRNYLGEQYKKEDFIQAQTGRRKAALPIVSVYLLGFALPELSPAALKVSRQYVDLLTHTVVEQKSDFIEKLTHDCYVVQLPRIEGKTRTRLDQLLSLFEQRYFIDATGTIKEYSYPIDDEIIKAMVEILRHAGQDPEGRRAIENEREAQRVYDVWFAEQNEVITRQAKEIEELKRRLGEL